MWLPGGDTIAQRLEADLSNLRSCVVWLRQTRDADRLLRLVGALMGFMSVRGYLREELVWLEHAVALGRDTGAPSLAGGLISLAAVVHLRGGEHRALALAEEGIELARARHDDFELVRGVMYAGLVALRRCELEQAAAFQREALALLANLGDASWVQLAESTVLGHLGNIAIAAGNVGDADALFAAALERQRALGHEPGTSHIYASHPLAGLGDVARARGDQAQALVRYQEALGHARRFRDTRAIAYALGGVAGALAAAGRWEAAARLFGAAEALHEQAGLPFDLETMDRQRALGLPEPWQRAGDSYGTAQPLRDALGGRLVNVVPAVPDTTAAARAWGEGRALSLTAAVAEAASVAIPAGQIRLDSPNHGLTPRELEVLRLVAAGSSNAQVAEALFISVPTAKRHVTNVLGKLALPSRSAAAAYAHRHHLD
jgi:DNA-binding CsgD family transcriptional regulator/tetratricopeptide (TPR) repeat protein